MRQPNHSIETILLEAIEIDDDADRRAYLDRVCGHDSDLRDKVGRLVALHFQADDFLEFPVFDARVNSKAVEPSDFEFEGTGSRIGSYRLLEPIAEGGMGQVFVAEQLEPVRRRVALKLIRAGMDTRPVVARFEAERQALALMDHPNIARVFDGGTARSGRPYFVMELIHGLPITDYCDEARLDIHRRLELFIPVCMAIQHAHQKGVIHRDLKPANILVTFHDREPVPKVIDFGIAKALNQRLGDATLYTGFTQFLGTPAYMSPEQFELNGLDVDTRSDVYSLGVILHELLTGVAPFDPDDLARSSFDAMRELVRERDPLRPSARFAALEPSRQLTRAAQRGLDPRHLREELRGDLDCIVMKVLEKDRNRRYESPSALAADIQRYFQHEPLNACPPSLGYRCRKFARKNRVALAASMAVAASLLAGTVVATWQAIRATRAEQRWISAAALAETRKSIADRHLQAARLRLAWQSLEAGQPDRAQAFLDESPPSSASGFLHDYLLSRSRREVVRIPGAEQFVNCYVLMNDGNLLVMGESSGALVFWDAQANRMLDRVEAHPEGISLMAVSPDQRTIATVPDLGGRHGPIRLWDVDRRRLLAELADHGDRYVATLGFQHDGQGLVVLAHAPHQPPDFALVYDLGSERMTPALRGRISTAGPGVVDPLGRFTLLTLPGGILERLDGCEGETVWKVETPPTEHRVVSLSADGERLAHWDGGSVAVRRTSDGHEVARFEHEGPEPQSITLGDRGHRLAVVDKRGDVVVHDVDTSSHKALHLRPDESERGRSTQLDFSPDESRLALVAWGLPGGSSPLVVHDLLAERPLATYPFAIRRIGDLQFAPDGQSVYHNGDTSLKRWFPVPTTHSGPRRLAGHGDEVWCLAFQPGGSLLASGGDDTDEPRTLQFSSLTDLRSTSGWGAHPGTLSCLAWSPDGRRLATAALAPRANLRMWDTGNLAGGASAAAMIELVGDPGWVRALAFSPDGKTLASAGDDGRIRLWDSTTGQSSRILAGHPDKARSLAFSPDGQSLASAGNDRSVRLWRLAANDEPRVVPTLSEAVVVSFAPDGQTLLALEQEGRVVLLDPHAGERLAMLQVDDKRLFSLALSPDGQTLAIAGESQAIFLWDLPTRQELLVLRGHTSPIHALAWSSDGHSLASGSHAGEILLWTSRVSDAP